MLWWPVTDDIDPAHVWRWYFPPGLHDGVSQKISLFLCSLSELGRVMLHRHRLWWWSVNMSEYTVTGDTHQISQTRIPELGPGGWGLATKTGGGRRSIGYTRHKMSNGVFSFMFLYQFPSTNNISCFHLPGQVSSSRFSRCVVLCILSILIWTIGGWN